MKNDPFSNEQTDTLENTFDAKKYLTNAERKRLAKALALSERQVAHFFNNLTKVICVSGEDLVPEQKGQMATPIASRFGLLALTGSQRRFWRYGAASTPDIGSSRAVWQFLWTF